MLKNSRTTTKIAKLAAYLYCFWLFVNLSCLGASSQVSATDSLELPSVSLRQLRDYSLPFVVNRIDKQQIAKHYRAQELSYLLADLVPSMVAYSDAGTGVGQTSFRIRGTEAKHSFISVNGAPLNDLESMGIYLGNIPDITSSATAIQVNRGVGALGAEVISLGTSIYLQTQAKPAAKNSLELSSDYGRFNTMRNTVKFNAKAWKIGPRDSLSLTIRASQLHSDGYIERSMANYYSSYVGLAYTRPKTQLSLIYFGGITRNQQAWGGIDAQDLLHNRRKNTLGLRTNAPPYNQKDHYTQHNLQLLGKFQLRPNLLITNTLYTVLGYGFYDNYKEQAKLAKYLPHSPQFAARSADVINELWLDNTLIGNTWNLRYDFGRKVSSLSSSVSNRHSLGLGLSLQLYRGSHFAIVDIPQVLRARYQDFSPAWKAVAGGSVYWQYQLSPKLTLYSALQTRALQYKIPGDRNAPDLRLQLNYLFLNPSMGLTYSYGKTRIILSYTYSNREPTRNDLVSSQGLARPERLHDLEFQYTRRMGKLQLSHTFYAMYYLNQLVATGAIDDVGAVIQKNVRSSLRSGLESQVSAQILRSLQLRLMFSVMYNRWLEFSRNNQLTSKTLPFSPSIIASGFLDYSPLPDLSLSWRAQYVGGQFLNLDMNPKLRLPGYFLNSVSVSYKRELTRQLNYFALRAGVDNLFNQMYSPNAYVYAGEAYYYPAMGISYNLQLRLGFKW